MLYDPKWNKVDAVGQVLLSAADYMDKHGWCGTGSGGPDTEVCLIIAVCRAMYAIHGHAGINDWDLESKIRSAALHRLEQHLGTHPCGIIQWNEEVCRSKEQAVAALRGAALCNEDGHEPHLEPMRRVRPVYCHS
jgi:hypothetical protein